MSSAIQALTPCILAVGAADLLASWTKQPKYPIVLCTPMITIRIMPLQRSLPWASREALQALIPRILGAGATETAGEQHDAAGEAGEGRLTLDLEGLDRGRLLGLMRDRTSSHLMEARPLLGLCHIQSDGRVMQDRARASCRTPEACS